MQKNRLERVEKYIDIYEHRNNSLISSVEPFIVRIKQEAYSEFCRDFCKPYDSIYFDVLTNTARRLCRELPSCRLGYIAQNEIDLIFVYSNVADFRHIWTSKPVEYVASTITSRATNIFNEELLDAIKQQEYRNENKRPENQQIDVSIYRNKLFKVMFKASVFNFPKDLLYTFLKYRNICAMRNSLVEAALAYMPDSERVGKKSEELKELLVEKYNYDYDSPHESCRFKYGVVCNKLMQDGNTSCVLVDLTRPLKDGGKDKINFEKMMFSDNSMGTISSRYVI